jgi:hypothetical protein
MALPASVRVNAQFPFPSLVQGEGGIAVSKANGIWTIAPNFSALAAIVTLTQPAGKQVWVFDPVAGVYNVMTLANLGSALFTDTSSSSVTIGLGPQSFTVGAGKVWGIGSWIIVSSAADPANFMVGQIIAYADTALTLNVTVTGGAGTFADWVLSLSGAPSPAIPLGSSSIEFLFDGGGAPLAPGLFGYLEVPFACTITRATLAATATGSAVADIWRVPPGGFPPSAADSITAAAPPTLADARFAQDATLVGWTTALEAGDILAFVLTSVAGIGQLTLSLALAR